MLTLTALALPAAAWHGDHGPWPLLWLVWLLIVGALVYVGLRRRGPGGPGRGPTADAILAERYARGEIDAEEYRERLATLRSS